MKLMIKTADQIRNEHRVQLKARLARIRWEYQVGGLALADGTEIRTDDATRAALSQAVTSFAAGALSGVVPWKMADGAWRDLSQADLIAINAAVAGHVQIAFAAERQVSAQIEAAADLAGFDVYGAFSASIEAAT